MFYTARICVYITSHSGWHKKLRRVKQEQQTSKQIIINQPAT